jgi:hypothetical protein
MPPNLRPTDQEAALSVAAKLMVTRFALNEVLKAIDNKRNPRTGERWNARDRASYVRGMCDEALRQSQ